MPIDVPLPLPENKASDTHKTDIDVVDKKVNSDVGKDLSITGEAACRCTSYQTGASNDSFLLNTLKTLFRSSSRVT